MVSKGGDFLKLNADCVRDILLAVEDATDASMAFRYGKAGPCPRHLVGYSHNEIVYHFRQCRAAQLFEHYTGDDMGRLIVITDLSPDGHKFLENIRQDGAWNKVKAAAASAGSLSISAFMQIALDVAGNILKGRFGLT